MVVMARIHVRSRIISIRFPVIDVQAAYTYLNTAWVFAFGGQCQSRTENHSHSMVAGGLLEMS